MADIEEDAGRRVADEIGGTFVAADVTREADVEAITSDIDILVNNAGGYEEPPFPDALIAHWTRVRRRVAAADRTRLVSSCSPA